VSALIAADAVGTGVLTEFVGTAEDGSAFSKALAACTDGAGVNILLARAAASAAIARLAGFSALVLAAAVLGGTFVMAGALAERAAAADEAAVAAAPADEAAAADAARAADGAGAATAMPPPSIGANASIRSSVMVKPEYSSGANPSSCRPCTTI